MLKDTEMLLEELAEAEGEDLATEWLPLGRKSKVVGGFRGEFMVSVAVLFHPVSNFTSSSSLSAQASLGELAPEAASELGR